ncbi:uncharacterized protein LOC110022920 isoform X2 [Phalaenopsis equestris]|uniref:uncharacterized protein LOC110022920 isoform X2 n=1 Tax=Phalaenopsis equestris TaxID=78828 RepID=UPI0009E223DD|nr:uncharacterized protein LOC110022920 isoform X2 [Phalaenopsis equestris]
MARLGRAKKQDKLGTGKVTPMQIAFIVDRYLADNNYSTTLSSFRSEASDLLSRTHGKEVPKGLMGLADILDDYIRLKEQRLIMDREKQKVEAAMKGMQDLIQVYHSEPAEGASVPIATSPLQIMASPAVPFPCGLNPINPTHLNNMMHIPSISNNSKPLLLPPKAVGTSFSTPTYTQSSTEKRKAPKSIAQEHTSPKKLRTQSPNVSNIVQGSGLSSQETSTSNNARHSKGKNPLALSTCDDNSNIQPSVQGSSVVKKLFRHSEGFQPIASSPKTPPQALTSQMDKSLSPLENSAVNAADTNSFPIVSSSSCSLISSETIIISPLKHKGFYAVERSYQVTCSPIKTCSTKLGKREHVKSRLDFDKADAFESMEKPSKVDNSTSSPSDTETSAGLDFDLPDFGIFDGDFLSGLLVDFGDHNEGFSGCHNENACIIAGQEESGGFQNLPDYSISAAAGATSECIGFQGSSDCVNSVKK